MICRVDETGGTGERKSYDIDHRIKKMIRDHVRREIQKYVIRKRKDNWIMSYIEKMNKDRNNEIN